MKNLVFIILLFPGFLKAQEKLSALTSPTSPASSVLGLQPTVLLAPKSFQALETAVYSNFFNSKTITPAIPNDFALEFTPYWFKNHKLSLADYLFPKHLFKDQIVRNSSFSLASTQNYMLGDSTASNALGLGYRTTLFFGSTDDKNTIIAFRENLKKDQLIIARLGSKVEVIMSDNTTKALFVTQVKQILMDELEKVYGFSLNKADSVSAVICIRSNEMLPELTNANKDQFLDSFYDLVISELELNKVFSRFKDYIKERQGWSVNIAYSLLVNFPGNNFEYSVAPKQSFWVTPTYRFKKNLHNFRATGVFRYEWYDTDYYKRYFPGLKIYQNNFDYGFALSGEVNKFSIQLEIAGRNSKSEISTGQDVEGNELFKKEESRDFQCIGTINYRLTDQIILSYNLGNRFDPITNPTATLVSLLSLNFGFGSPTTENIK